MPLYEYQCPSCGTFENIQKFSDPLLKKCPTCGKKVEKKLSAPGLSFKGAGWWVTDYGWKAKGEGKGESKSEGKGESKSEGKGESKSEGKGESKSAAKSETKADKK